jgi:hypothetical protein
MQTNSGGIQSAYATFVGLLLLSLLPCERSEGTCNQCCMVLFMYATIFVRNLIKEDKGICNATLLI